MIERWKTIHEFWFGDIEQPDYPTQDRYKLWFGKSPTTDLTIKENFEADLLRAASGAYESWERSPQSSLALVILQDQFPRNIYRDSAKAFIYDKSALALVLRGLKNKFDQTLAPIERVFFYLPLEHSEDLAVQQKSVATYRTLLDSLDSDLVRKYQGYLDYAIRHFEIIERFGRFPHRNRVLARESTAEELEFLSKPGAAF